MSKSSLIYNLILTLLIPPPSFSFCGQVNLREPNPVEFTLWIAGMVQVKKLRNHIKTGFLG